MTEPRKEQINDPKTKFTRVDSAGTMPLGPGAPPSSVQIIQNTLGENFYDEFLASSITQTVGGAETNAPAIAYGGFGPFSIAAGQAFAIAIPGVVGGAATTITIQPSDIVILGGSPVLTTSRAATRINTVMAGVGVTTPVAADVNGQLVLTAATSGGVVYGATASMTLTDITAGMVLALGFGAAPQTVTGVSAPQRGIITTSQDGLGGFVQLRRADSTPAITQSNVVLHLGGFNFTPSVPPGQPVNARIQAFPGAHLLGENFKISYYRQGLLQNQVFTQNSNFSTILNVDTFTLTITLPGVVGSPFVSTVSFGVAPTTVQNVIDAFNAAWNVCLSAIAGQEALRGAVFPANPSPYNFKTGKDSFFIILNGNAPINIQPTEAQVTATDLAAFINGAIVGAGQGAQGEAVVYIIPTGNVPTVIIRSKALTGPASSVGIAAGNVGGLTPGGLMTTLDKLGISPGIYTGSFVAFPYGNDEILFKCPTHIQGSTIQISGALPTMAKLGFSAATITGTTIQGAEPVVPPLVHALIPEIMRFGEVPTNYDTTVQQFLSTDEPNPAQPPQGVGNLGISPLLGQDGKVNSNLLQKIVDTFNVDQLVLGRGSMGSAADQAKPRIVTPYNSTLNFTLIWEGTSTGGSSPVRNRLYINNGDLYLTTNSSWNGVNWSRDDASQDASALHITQGHVNMHYSAAAAGNPFNFDSTNDRIVLDPSGVNPFASLGVGSNETQATAAIARIGFPTNSAFWTNILTGVGTVGHNVRAYIQPSAPGSTILFTVNAGIDGATGLLAKDLLGTSALGLAITESDVRVLIRNSASVGEWNPVGGWDSTPVRILATSVNVAVPVVANAYRLNTPDIQTVTGLNITITLNGGFNDHLIKFSAGTTIAAIDMTAIPMNNMDSFRIVFEHSPGNGQVNNPAAWGTNTFFETPLDAFLSNVVGNVDVFTFINPAGTSATGTRRLMATVVRYSGVPTF